MSTEIKKAREILYRHLGADDAQKRKMRRWSEKPDLRELMLLAAKYLEAERIFCPKKHKKGTNTTEKP
jgi:hypothetical protein